MISSKQKITDTRKRLSENRKVAQSVSDWVADNRKVFWKYEVSCFYKTYVIRINNLPHPGPDDILISSNNRLLDNSQRNKLSGAVKTACDGAEISDGSNIDMRIDFIDGEVKWTLL